MLHSSAPGRGGGANERDPAEGPEQDALGDSAYLPAGEGVAEFMQQHDYEERQIFVDREDGREITMRARGELIHRHEKPAEV